MSPPQLRPQTDCTTNYSPVLSSERAPQAVSRSERSICNWFPIARIRYCAKVCFRNALLRSGMHQFSNLVHGAAHRQQHNLQNPLGILLFCHRERAALCFRPLDGLVCCQADERKVSFLNSSEFINLRTPCREYRVFKK
jgi:hypothetical protein